MHFTLVIQMKGLVIRVIADNNPGLHQGCRIPACPSHHIACSHYSCHEQSWAARRRPPPPLFSMIKPASDSEDATQGGVLESHALRGLSVIGALLESRHFS